MKILVTGASGLLGSEIVNSAKESGFDCCALDRIWFLGASADERSAILSGCDVIIHSAANTDLEQCEIDQEKCFFDNCYLTELLYQHSVSSGVKFVYISSTGVYGRHKSQPYHEYDVVSPTTVHHRSKYVSENIVLRSVDTLVIRTGWLFGGALGQKKNFVAKRLAEIRTANGPIFSNSVQIGSPTYTRDCAVRLLELLYHNCSGVYNVVNGGAASRYDYVKMIAGLSRYSVDVLPSDLSKFSRVVDVSENESAFSYRMKFEGRVQLRTWQDALCDYMTGIDLA